MYKGVECQSYRRIDIRPSAKKIDTFLYKSYINFAAQRERNIYTDI